MYSLVPVSIPKGLTGAGRTCVTFSYKSRCHTPSGAWRANCCRHNDARCTSHGTISEERPYKHGDTFIPQHTGTRNYTDGRSTDQSKLGPSDSHGEGEKPPSIIPSVSPQEKMMPWVKVLMYECPKCEEAPDVMGRWSTPTLSNTDAQNYPRCSQIMSVRGSLLNACIIINIIDSEGPETPRFLGVCRR